MKLLDLTEATYVILVSSILLCLFFLNRKDRDKLEDFSILMIALSILGSVIIQNYYIRIVILIILVVGLLIRFIPGLRKKVFKK